MTYTINWKIRGAIEIEAPDEDEARYRVNSMSIAEVLEGSGGLTVDDHFVETDDD